MRRIESRKSQLLIALGVAGFLLFNFPLMLIWDQDLEVFGLPLLPVALFSIWLALIVALIWLLERGKPPAAQSGTDEDAE